MKIFAIKDETDVSKKTLAWLIYYENSKRFYIELPEDGDIWHTPLLLSSFLKKGEKTINAYWSEVWVNQRIIPSDRQNLGQILKENGLNEYDPYKLLILAKGRCAQDDYYIEQIKDDKLPKELIDRFKRKIDDVVPLTEYGLLVFFCNGIVKKCSLRNYFENNRIYGPLLSNKSLYNTMKVSSGGYGIYWGENLEITSEELYKLGVDVPLSLNDFISFVKERVISSGEVAELLNCSRQNLDDLVKRGKLHPIKVSARNKLYLKNEVEQRVKKSV